MRTQEGEMLGFAHEAIRLNRVHVAQGGIPFSGGVGNGRAIPGLHHAEPGRLTAD
ncbi:hypothetical protein [Streptomyces sp. NPDC059258]|uniref:hypothetical protein n=1 Tax=unclassified Streptomyces TaxID=2593676 RepID=UPI003698C7FA